MKLSLREKVALDFYDINAVLWSKAHSDKNYWKEEFTLYKRYLPQGKVLEVGCGGGRDAEVLMSLGFDYIGTDISEGLLKVAIKTVPSLKFLKQDIYNLEFPKGSLDGFWASAVFLHIPKSKISKALKSLKKIIKPGGVGFISVKEGVGEKFTDDVEKEFAGKRFWSFFKLKEFKNILKQNGYKVIKSYRKPISEKTTWLVYFVKP